MSCWTWCLRFLPPSFGKHMSRWSASHVGDVTATSLTNLANSLAMVALHVAGMCRTVDTCAANTSSNVGASGGHGNVRAVPAEGGVWTAGSNGMGVRLFLRGSAMWVGVDVAVAPLGWNLSMALGLSACTLR